MAKKNLNKKVMLLSEGVDEKGHPTKSVYYVFKGGNTQKKLALKKFDKKAFNKETSKLGMHVVFNEKKIPK